MVTTATNEVASVEAESALDRLVTTTSVDMERVNALILQRADSHVDMVPELARYLIEAGGKRLRPMLTLASAKLFGNPDGSEINFAAAVEFMHNATLLHDDVVDESLVRRGQPAARMVWGNQASVLVGDFLLGQAFLMMVESRDLEALEILSRAATVIAEGEVFQLVKTRDLNTTSEDYDQVIRAKTAALFEAATRIGAKAGGGTPEQASALGEYGLQLGRAFQLIDDVLDYGGATGTLGKNTGDDLREGKMTLPIILTLKAATDNERAVITASLGQADADAEALEAVVAIMAKYGALQQTVSDAEEYARIAQEALSKIPESETRKLLADVASFCVERAY